MNSLTKTFFSIVGRNTIHHFTESYPLSLSTDPEREMLSDLTTISRMIHLHLGPRLVSARLTDLWGTLLYPAS